MRNQGLSAAQIHFSRDINIGENLVLNDEKLMEDKISKREKNHPSSIKSKSPKGKEASSPSLTPGQIVFAYENVSKHNCRDPLLITNVDGNKVQVQKVLHSQENSVKGPRIGLVLIPRQC